MLILSLIVIRPSYCWITFPVQDPKLKDNKKKTVILLSCLNQTPSFFKIHVLFVHTYC